MKKSDQRLLALRIAEKTLPGETDYDKIMAQATIILNWLTADDKQEERYEAMVLANETLPTCTDWTTIADRSAVIFKWIVGE